MDPDGICKFGTFEFDLRAGELRKRGIRLKLQPKPVAVLSLLVRHAGQIVTQEQLRQELWEADTFVDFEHSLGVAIWKLRIVLGDTAENPRYIETISRRGYRFLAPVASSKADAGLRKMLAVLPLQDLGKPADDYFAEGLTEELITEVGRINPKRLGVIARSSSVRFKESGVRVRDIAADLGVEYIARGTVRRLGKRIRVTAQLLNAADESQIWGDSYDRVADDIIEMQVQIAQQIVAALAIQLLPDEAAAPARNHTETLEAYELYLQGRHHWNRRTPASVMTAIEYFERAAAADPHFALAHAGLADCYLVLGFYGEMAPADAFAKSKTCAAKALEIDDSLPEAHSSLAFCLLQYDWNGRAAEHEHLRAIHINPNCAPAHHWYGLTLTQLGRFSEASRAFARALELDPFSVAIQAHIGRLSYFCRDFERAVSELRRAVELDRGYFPARYFLALALSRHGSHREAMAELESAVAESGGHPILLSGLACVAGSAGKRTTSRRIVADLLAARTQRRVPPYFLAMAFVSAAQHENALHCLEEAYVERHGWLFYLKMEPAFDDLRPHPQFVDLVRRVEPAMQAAAHVVH